MAKYWIDSPVAWSVDAPVHAGMCRVVMQDNLQSVHDNSGFHISTPPISSAYYSGVILDDWIWFEPFKPIPIPVYQGQSGTGWRSYTIEIRAQYTVAGDLRIYLLDTQARPHLNSATGVVEGTTAYGAYALAGPMAWYAKTIDLDQIGSEPCNGHIIPVVWMHIAGNSHAGGAGETLYIVGHSISESA